MKLKTTLIFIFFAILGAFIGIYFYRLRISNNKQNLIPYFNNALSQYEYAKSLGHGNRTTSMERFYYIIKAYNEVLNKKDLNQKLKNQVYCDIAHFYNVHIHDWNNAQKYYKKVIDNGKIFLELYESAKKNYAISYYNCHDYEQAVIELQKCSQELTLLKNKIYVLTMLSRIKFEQGNYRDSIIYIKEALEFYGKVKDYTGANPVFWAEKIYSTLNENKKNINKINFDEELKNLRKNFF
jgi:tetratricopeptide (TPR) repeat protein